MFKSLLKSDVKPDPGCIPLFFLWFYFVVIIIMLRFSSKKGAMSHLL